MSLKLLVSDKTSLKYWRAKAKPPKGVNRITRAAHTIFAIEIITRRFTTNLAKGEVL